MERDIWLCKVLHRNFEAISYRKASPDAFDFRPLTSIAFLSIGSSLNQRLYNASPGSGRESQAMSIEVEWRPSSIFLHTVFAVWTSNY